MPFCILSQENNAILCSDGIDNDGDGLIDCEDSECNSLSNNGCAICSDGLSFADVLIEYVSGCTLEDTDPNGAVGINDWLGAPNDAPEFVFLGGGGIIKLGFTNNLLTNSGSSDEDLWVFEVGPAVEASFIALKPANSFTETQLQLFTIDANADGYYEMGGIGGATAGLDIDQILPGYNQGQLVFDAVEIKDANNGNCSGGTPGADIDAVCALSSIVVDCAGTVNGRAEIDDCGECLEPNDPSFNQSCIDCAGIPNGTSEIDDCGECREPIDPGFDNSCKDCLGVIDGIAEIDECGECLQPNDPDFNKTCVISIPDAFTPNNDGINDVFNISISPRSTAKVTIYTIYNRWGQKIYQRNDFKFSETSNWWNGEVKGKGMLPGVFLYKIEVQFANGKISSYNGIVSSMK